MDGLKYTEATQQMWWQDWFKQCAHLYFKDNSEFNTGNTDIKLGVGEQGKKQYDFPLSLRGYWHRCGL